ncbi:hypothetical protein J6590_004612 [Homalodisca vitripennis]|nr:hypothetical protein J6590_004612 [Homalodisca vitripennis]
MVFYNNVHHFPGRTSSQAAVKPHAVRDIPTDFPYHRTPKVPENLLLSIFLHDLHLSTLSEQYGSNLRWRSQNRTRQRIAMVTTEAKDIGGQPL